MPYREAKSIGIEINLYKRLDEIRNDYLLTWEELLEELYKLALVEQAKGIIEEES